MQEHDPPLTAAPAADPRRAPLPPAFYRRDALEVARDLIGRWLIREEVVLRITEAEAYRGPSDTACHTRVGRTARNAAMWGPPGRAYVYRCYGLHWMLNAVTGEEGDGCAVLLRAAEPVEGLAVVAARRGGRAGPEALNGPARLTAALAVDGSLDRHDLTAPGGLVVAVGEPTAELLAGPRVGIDYAAPADREAPWRVAAAGTPWVGHRRTLRPASPPAAPGSATGLPSR